jgi:uncharacterized protein
LFVKNLLITPLYASILALFFIGLSLRVVLLRRKSKTSLSDGGNTTLLRAIRAHANFAEYVPFALMLMAFSEMNGLHSGWLHGSGVCLLFARAFHAFAIQNGCTGLPRVAGIAMTFTVLGGNALLLLWH